MPLVAPALKQKLEQAILAGLQREFAKESAVDPTTYKRMAAAISDIATVLVTAITTEAEVLAGAPTAGGPASQVTVGPSKIL
jgi:hypothetical protein